MEIGKRYKFIADAEEYEGILVRDEGGVCDVTDGVMYFQGEKYAIGEAYLNKRKFVIREVEAER